jgi:hypothetical protein
MRDGPSFTPDFVKGIAGLGTRASGSSSEGGPQLARAETPRSPSGPFLMGTGLREEAYTLRHPRF